MAMNIYDGSPTAAPFVPPTEAYQIYPSSTWYLNDDDAADCLGSAIMAGYVPPFIPGVVSGKNKQKSLSPVVATATYSVQTGTASFTDAIYEDGENKGITINTSDITLAPGAYLVTVSGKSTTGTLQTTVGVYNVGSKTTVPFLVSNVAAGASNAPFSATGIIPVTTDPISITIRTADPAASSEGIITVIKLGSDGGKSPVTPFHGIV